MVNEPSLRIVPVQGATCFQGTRKNKPNTTSGSGEAVVPQVRQLVLPEHPDPGVVKGLTIRR